jgi:hypothetical protein
MEGFSTGARRATSPLSASKADKLKADGWQGAGNCGTLNSLRDMTGTRSRHGGFGGAPN